MYVHAIIKLHAFCIGPNTTQNTCTVYTFQIIIMNLPQTGASNHNNGMVFT